MAYETDTDMLVIWNGSAWRYIAATTPTNGTVLQIVTTNVTARSFSTASSTYVDVTDLNVSITPKSTTSKVLLFGVVTGGNSNASYGINYFQFLRDSTAIGNGGQANAVLVNINADAPGQATMFHIDSPASTSSITYKVQARTQSGTFYLNRRSSTDLYNGISSITAMEIAG
jgi:hypothetical protein